MIISFNVPDEVLGSVQQYIQTRYTFQPDPITGQPVKVMVYNDVHDFFIESAAMLLQQICMQYPTFSYQAQINDVESAKKLLLTAVTPTKVA